jgi:hypothetical protein
LLWATFLLSFAQKHGVQCFQQYQQIQEKGKILNVEQFVLKRLQSVRNRIHAVGLGPPRDSEFHIIAHPIKEMVSAICKAKCSKATNLMFTESGSRPESVTEECQIAENGLGRKSVGAPHLLTASSPCILPRSALRLPRSELPTFLPP